MSSQKSTAACRERVSVVRFSERVKCKSFVRPKGEVERELHWSSDDMEGFYRNARAMAHQMDDAGLEFCFRGLERFHQPHAVKKAQRRRQALDAVLDYQELCWIQKEKNPDDKVLASLYSQFTRASECDAYTMGLRDQRAAKKEETRSMNMIVLKKAISSPSSSASVLCSNSEKVQSASRAA